MGAAYLTNLEAAAISVGINGEPFFTADFGTANLEDNLHRNDIIGKQMPQSTKKTPQVASPLRISEGPLATLIGYHLRRAYSVFQSDLANVLAPFDLRPMSFSVLVIVSENAGLSQTQISTALNIERPNLVAIIDSLEERALIKREQVPSDRRVYALKISKKGQDLLSRAQSAVYAHEHRLLEDQPQDQVRILMKTLKMIESKSIRNS